MKRIASLLLLFSTGAPNDPAPLPRTILARAELLAETRRLVNERNAYVLPAYADLMKRADSALSARPVSVTQKTATPPSGDKHDFLSLAPYWWPDPSKPSGLPYIRRDGEMNPQSRLDHDGLRFLAMTDMVESLALAYWFTGEERYARRAAYFVRVFFLDRATRMNPNLNFAQAIPGITPGRGIGILDVRHMPRLLDAIRIIDRAPSWRATDKTQFEVWCRAYLKWLRESQNGKEERAEKNNHGTLYDMQAASLALFLGDSAFAKELLGPSARSRIDSEIHPDGSQPLELDRTRPIHYSLFNLDAFTALAEMSRHVGSDLWHYRGKKGQSIAAALRFVAPYTDTSHKWSKRDIVPIAPEEASTAMRRAAAALIDSTFERAAARATRSFGSPSRETLFYPGITLAALGNIDALTRHAVEFARSRLRQTAQSLDPANGYPRFTEPDGRWQQQPYNQWTAGFFAGTLWSMYALDRAREWQSLAARWTRGIEPARSMTTTHDLGFMVFNSFGHGFLLTRDTTYRRVVLDASRSLVTRYNPRVGAIKSWDTENGRDARRTWKYPVIVDNLMNLEMLFKAAKWGDPHWRDIAEHHALTSARVHVRPDGSTAHVALFDPVSGKLEGLVTWQGFSDSSTWARGQAWAIYGFTRAYAYTRNPELLRTAQRAADWFIEHDSPDGVPYWDMRHPAIPYVERDASAAAIAASGLYDLSRQSRGANAKRYREVADRILRALSSQYLAAGTPFSSILLHSVGNRPQNSEIDVGLVYADYYFVEALLRRRGLYVQ
jgi:unsaturated chondroitin disaccharide hydrolase